MSLKSGGAVGGAARGILAGLQVAHGIKSDNRRMDLAEKRDMREQENTRFSQGMATEQNARAEQAFNTNQDEVSFQREQRKAQQQALRFNQAIYDNKGNLKTPDKWDRATIADIGNQMDMTRAYLGDSPDVDPENPLLEVVPFKTGDGEKITFRLRRKDGGTGVLTRNRTSEGSDEVVALSPDAFVGEMHDLFAGYGIARPGDPVEKVDPLAKEKFKAKADIDLENVKAANARKAKGGEGDDADKHLYTNLPEDVQAMLGDTQVDDLTGKVVSILDPERVNSFLGFWKNQSNEKDPRKAVAMFKDAETLNDTPVEEVVASLNENPGGRAYTVRLLSPEKRAELRAFLEQKANGRGLVPQSGPPMQSSHGRGM
jgi:hypothetical protein